MDRRREIVESQFEPSVNSLWLYKKTLKIFINGKWEVLGTDLSPEEVEELKTKVDSMDKELGEVKQDISIINSKVCVELEIGNSEEVKSRNLAKLKAIQSVDHLFFADIDYGYGAAKWLPTTGGEAFIVTSSGKAVIYTIAKDGAITKTSTDIDLTNPSTDLFEVVTELPVENISTSKIYCVLSSTKGEKNKYTEYAYIKQTDGQFAWEKMGEFKAEPDLSGYAKLSGAVFTGELRASNNMIIGGVISINDINKYDNRYLRVVNINDKSNTKVFATDGSIADLSTKANASDLNNCAKLNGTNTFSGDNTFTAGGNVQISFLKCDNIRKTNKGYLFDLDDTSRNDHTTYTNDGGKADIGTAEWLRFTLEDGTIVNKSIRVLKNTVTPAT